MKLDGRRLVVFLVVLTLVTFIQGANGRMEGSGCGANFPKIPYVQELAFWENNWHYLAVGKVAGAVPAGWDALTSTTYNGEPRVYYIGTDGHVQELAYWGNNWHYLAVGKVAGAVPAGWDALTSTTYNGEPRVYYIGTDGYVQELAFWGNNFHYLAVGKAAGAVPAANGSALTSTTYNGEPRVYYIGTDGYVQELAFWGNNWHYLAVGKAAGAVPAESFAGRTGPDAKSPWTTSLTSTTYNGEPRVYYIGTDHHVQELAFWENNWHYLAVGKEAGGVFALPSALTSTTYNGEPRVYYISTSSTYDTFIQELAFWGNNWHYNALGNNAGGLPGSINSVLTSTTYRGEPLIYYIGTDDYVQELAYWDSNFHYLGVGKAAGGVPVAFSGALTSTTYNGEPRVYYLG